MTGPAVRTFNLADLFEVVADAAPDRLALVAGDVRLTYAQLDERSSRLAHHLMAGGIEPGDWVGIYSWNRAEWVESMIACYKAHAVPINVNYRYVAAELAYLFDNADLRGLIFERGFAPIVADVAPGLPVLEVFVVIEDGTEADNALDGLDAVSYEDALASSDPARAFPPRSSDDLYVLYTGGTTGMPKGVKWRGEDIYLAAMSGARGNAPLESPEDLAQYAGQPGVVTFALAPMMHGGAQWSLWSLLTTAGTVVLWCGHTFDADAILRIAAAERVVSISLIGDAMARPLVEAYAAAPDDYDLSGLALIGSGGAMLSQGVRVQLEQHFPGVRIADSFGTSETGFNGTSSGVATRFAVGPGTTVLDDELRPVAPGSGVVGLLARSGHIPLGYHKDDTKTAATFLVDPDGRRWVVPGDLATVEADGEITVFGRGSQVVNTGGEKVFPEEVEAALKAYPGVFDAVVVGVPDERFGEHVAALVVWREGSEPDLDALRADTRTHVAGYKVPKEIHVLDAVQRTPAGKPDYRWAKTRATELAAESGSMSGAPEFHLYLPQMRLSMDAMVEKAQAAEAAGFVGMAGMDHLAPPMAEQHGMYEALTTNAWLLARTERLVQGQLVLCDAFRHPAVLAREAVTLDHASGGRFELGIGWGSAIEEFTTYGVSPTAARERVQRLAETLDILRGMWSGDPFDYDGQYFQLHGARQAPVPLAKIPMVIGGTGKRTMELVAAHADWWNVPIHQLERLDEMRASAGSARVSVQQMFAFVPEGVDRAAVEEPAHRRFGYQSLVVGGRAEIVDHFSAMRERGVERFYVWFADFAPPSTLEAFGAEVISSF